MDTYTDTESYQSFSVIIYLFVVISYSLNIQWKYPKWLWQFVFVYYCVLFISTEETMKEAVVWPLKKQWLVQPHLKVHLVAAFNLITFIIVSRGRLPSLPVWYYSNVECNIFSIHGTFLWQPFFAVYEPAFLLTVIGRWTSNRPEQCDPVCLRHPELKDEERKKNK